MIKIRKKFHTMEYIWRLRCTGFLSELPAREFYAKVISVKTHAKKKKKKTADYEFEDDLITLKTSATGIF